MTFEEQLRQIKNSFIKGELEGIDELFAQLEKLVESPSQRLELCLQQAQIYVKQQRLDELQKIIEKGAYLAQKAGDTDKQGAFVGVKGVAALSAGRYSEAIISLSESIQYFTQTQNRDALAVSYNNLSIAFSKVKKYKASLEAAEKSLFYNQQQERKTGIANNYSSIAAIYLYLLDHQRALEFFQRAYTLHIELGNDYNAVTSLGNIGTSYSNLKLFDKALETFLEVLHKYKSIKVYADVPRILYNIGQVYSAMNDFSNALEYLYAALDETKLPIGEGHRSSCLLAIGRVYANAKFPEQDLTKAEKLFKEALLLSIDYSNTQESIHNELYLVYKERGLFKEALYHYEEVQKLREMEEAAENKKLVDRIAFEHELALAQKEKEVLQLYTDEIEQKKNIIEKQNKELQEQNATLEKLIKFNKLMTSTIVHDLKNPLSAILAYTDMEDVFPDCRLEIQYSAKGMANLVSNLLEIATFETANVELTQDAYSPLYIVEQAIQEVQHLLLFKPVTIDVQNTDINCTIWCDKSKIVRLLVNILTNSVKYASENSIITVSMQLVSNDSVSNVRFSIHNVGSYIPREHLQSIFEAYSRSDSGRDIGTNFSTGLGLAYCKMAVEAHQGTIWAESTKGEGTTFCFVLPTQEVLQAHTQEQPISSEVVLPDNDYQYTDAEKKAIASIAAEIRKRHIQHFEFSEVLDALENFPDTSEAVARWKSNFKSIVVAGDKEQFIFALQNATDGGR